jgi:hypothetical protein
VAGNPARKSSRRRGFRFAPSSLALHHLFSSDLDVYLPSPLINGRYLHTRLRQKGATAFARYHTPDGPHGCGQVGLVREPLNAVGNPSARLFLPRIFLSFGQSIITMSVC